MPKWNLDPVMGGMVVGDSFFVPCIQCTELQSLVHKLAAEFGIKVKIRTRFEHYVKGIRVWRVA
jgi:hypothetical protein